MSSAVVLDASAIIAVIKEEPGHEAVMPFIRNAVVLSVNFSEAVAYFAKHIVDDQVVSKVVQPFARAVVPYGFEESFLAGKLIRDTQQHGLSLGDRACIALGMVRKTSVITTDRAWAQLDVPIEIKLIR
ncbi:MAG: type II toxin-antitoxin system VapC family toxin [Cyanobacteria bacterium J06649_11]